MYIDNENFEKWMEKLSKKLTVIGTLQRYRVNNQLPYFTIGRKTYYRAVDIRAFVRERASQTYKQFEKDNQLTNQS